MQLLWLAFVGNAFAENGDQSTYRFAGTLGGHSWMSESQPTTNDCTTLQPTFIQSRYCGPGNGRAQQENVEVVDGVGLKLTAKVAANTSSADTSHVTNAQLYLCASEAECASVDGTTDMLSAVGNQKSMGPGTFVFQVDNWTSTGLNGAFPKPIVFAFYLYKPAMNVQGNVDTTNELDIEYHSWDDSSAENIVSFTSWAGTFVGPPAWHLATSETGKPSAEALPGCAAIQWSAGKSATYGIWSAVNGKCDPADCFGKDSCITREHASPKIPTEDMIPAINLWWVGDLSGVTDTSVSVTVSDFKYYPASAAVI